MEADLHFEGSYRTDFKVGIDTDVVIQDFDREELKRDSARPSKLTPAGDLRGVSGKDRVET